MNILLAGGSCSLINSMILKLRKEGHRVCLLTGDKYRHKKFALLLIEKHLKEYLKNMSFLMIARI